MPDTAAQVAIARGRSFSGNRLVISDSVAGIISAPPRPMRPRTTISWIGLEPHRRRGRPEAEDGQTGQQQPPAANRSPAFPEVSSRPAKTTM